MFVHRDGKISSTVNIIDAIEWRTDLKQEKVMNARKRQTMLMIQPQYVISARLKLCPSDICT